MNGVKFCAHKRNNRADEDGDGEHNESIPHEKKKEGKGYDVKQREEKRQEKTKRSGSESKAA